MGQAGTWVTHAQEDRRAGRVTLRRVLVENGLSLTLGTLFLVSFAFHVAAGALEHSSEQLQHGEQAVAWWEYLGTSRLWFESFQNWQSEFLAIAAMVVLAIYLRQRGSPESKPVQAPHAYNE